MPLYPNSLIPVSFYNWGNRKLHKNYYFSVEGETEKWYLKWLENQINSKDNASFKVNFTVYVQKEPARAAKRITSVDNIEIVFEYP